MLNPNSLGSSYSTIGTKRGRTFKDENSPKKQKISLNEGIYNFT